MDKSHSTDVEFGKTVASSAQLVESRTTERVPRLIERHRVIVLVNDQRDVVLPAVRRELLAMIVLDLVALVVGPGGRLQLCHAWLNHLGDERRGSHLDEVHRHDRRRQVDGCVIGWVTFGFDLGDAVRYVDHEAGNCPQDDRPLIGVDQQPMRLHARAEVVDVLTHRRQ